MINKQLNINLKALRMKNNYQPKLCNYNICSLAFLLLLVSGSWRAHAQDSCSTAQTITAGTHTIDVINGVNAVTSCSEGSLAEWFAYTPTSNYSVTITSDLPVNTCGDTYFSIYTGTCGSLSCLASDDDDGVITCSGGQSYLSVITFDAIAGTTYYIAWDDRWRDDGFTFQLIEMPYVPSPCATATTVTAGVTTVTAIDSYSIITPCSTVTMGEWYAYTPTQNYRVTISSDLPQNICKDTNFNVYTGTCSNNLICYSGDDNSGVITCNSGNTFSNLSKKTIDVEAGVTYYIVWDNKWSTAGFDFQITEEVIVIPVSYTSQTIATVNSSYNMCVVDMNNDGLDDIAGVSSNNLRVHYQGANGTFTMADFPITGTSRMPGWSNAAGDLNKDGYNDLMLGSTNGLSLWISNSTGTAYTNYTPGQNIFCQRTNFIDVNNDGHLDAFSCHDIAPNCYYLNNGAGVYTYYQSTVTPGSYNLGAVGGNYATIWSDLDNDGDQDMFVSKCSGLPCEIHRNDGNTYTDISAQAGINVIPDSWSSAVFDWDNDGDMDILVGKNGSIQTILFRNNLDTTNNVEEAYTNVTAGSGWETGTSARDYVAYDFDNDGYQDVLSSANRIMFNQGDGTFSATNYTNLSIGAIGDLNNDGFLDIQNGSTIRYAVPNGNKWFVVKLKGIQSNSNGIGARVEIYGTWGKQIRDIRSGEGFTYASTLNAHFGLGQATTIDKVVIKWPSGVVDTIMNPAANSAIQVVEGSTLGAQGFEYNNFTVFPNPAEDALTIQPGEKMAGIEAAEVFDLNGRLVLRPAVNNNTVSVKTLASGAYLLVIKTVEGKLATQKFLKK